MYRNRLGKWICCLLLAALFVGCLPAGAGLADSTATVCAASVTVYSSPYASSAIVLGTLTKGANVTVRAVSGNVAKINYNGRTGYINATQLNCGGTPATTAPTASASGVSAVVTADSLVVYTQASKSAASYGTIRKGVAVTILQTSGSWAAIRVAGKIGYCAAAGLSTASNAVVQNPVATAAPTVLPSATPSASTTAALAGGTAVVTADSLVVYKQANKGAGSYGTIRKGVTVTLLQTNGSWAAIRVAGKIGYCAAAGLSTYQDAVISNPVASATPAQTVSTPIQAGDAVVTAERLRFYKSTSTSASYYGTFKVGVALTVQSVSGQWAKVTYSGKTGCVLLSGLVLTGSAATAAPTASAPASGETHQAIHTASLYQRPSTSSKALKSLTAGTKITVTAASGGWLKVNLSGVTCYALDADFMEIGASTGTALVIVSSMNVYAQTSLSATTYGSIPEGTTIEVYATSNGWAKILYNGRKAYVQTSKLIMGGASYQSLASGSKGAAVLALQSRLETLGFFDGLPAGNYGSITAAAVKRFQSEAGLNVTGVANNATQAAAFASDASRATLLSRTLTTGSTGDYVSRLQTRLLYKNYYTGSVDGDYGAETAAAVSAFQKAASIAQTGTANPATLAALFAPGAPAAVVTSAPVGSNGTPSLSAPNTTSDNEDVETVIRYALAQLGKPYVYGTSGPNSFDCSGLTYYCFKKVGITLPRSAYDVGYASTLGDRIAFADLQRGDIVCFNTISDSDLSDHVGIYLGDGKFIHAPHTGSDVIVASITSSYYTRNFSWGRRVIH